MNLSNTTKVTVSELATILENTTASTVANIIYTVDESKSRTQGGKKAIQKQVQISHVYLNHDYTQKVKNLTGNTEFQANELKGKTRISSTLLQSDKTGKLLIDGKVLNSETANVLSYFHKGVVISKEDAIAQNLFAPSFFNSKPSTMGRGSVSEENDFRIINTGLEKINFIKLKGQVYEIVK